MVVSIVQETRFMSQDQTQNTPSSAVTVKDQKAAKRILVVDDEPDIVTLIKYHLEFEGYQILTACNGLEALDHAAASHPDLIVLDIMMPKVDGWVVCHSIKSTQATKDIRIIILTAKTQIRSKIKGLYILQADMYMTKPFELDELSENIAKLLGVPTAS
jgi:DNA-binding response OmpR family regulator